MDNERDKPVAAEALEAEVAESVESTEALAAKQDEDDPLAALQSELEKAQAQAAEYLDGWQRARAEFANLKKRVEAGVATGDGRHGMDGWHDHDHEQTAEDPGKRERGSPGSRWQAFRPAMAPSHDAGRDRRLS